MNKVKRIIVSLILICTLVISLCACGDNNYRKNPQTEDDIMFDMIQVMGYVKVADGFLATYASVIPSVFVDEKWTLTYEMGEKDGEEMYIAVVSGEYYPDYRDKESTKTGTIKFMMDLNNDKKKLRAKAPWPYEDPDNIDDIIWRFVTHKDPSER